MDWISLRRLGGPRTSTSLPYLSISIASSRVCCCGCYTSSAILLLGVGVMLAQVTRQPAFADTAPGQGRKDVC